MAENETYQRGVVVEFDFAVADGAEMLFEIAGRKLAEKGVRLSVMQEAKHLAGGNMHGALAELFSELGVDADAAQTAREIQSEFAAAVTAAVPGLVNDSFRAFVDTLTRKGVKVILATRADVQTLKAATAGLDQENVLVYAEPSTTYGGCKWDAWRRAVVQNGLQDIFTAAVAGSGHGVKSALVANLAVAAVEHPHVSYQDFGGADVVVESVGEPLAKELLRMLHLGA